MNSLQTLHIRVALALGASFALLLGAAGDAAARSKGIDVSRFQGKIDWKKTGRSKKVDFAYVQASRGSGNDCATVPSDCGADRFYDRNYKGARKEGISVGPYHRAFMNGSGKGDAKRDAKDEAKIFLKEVRSLKGDDLVPALDVETPFGGLGEKEIKVWIETWLDRVRSKLGGNKPLIYTNRSSWAATGDTESFAKEGHRLWVANFNVSKPAVPADNWNGQGWTMWQYSSTGSVKGINGNVDLNKLRTGIGKIEFK